MDHKVDRVMLFTLSACPMGRSMGTVLREISEINPNIKMETIFVDQEIERTNRFRIKNNPTTLFQAKDGRVIARLEGFHETEEIKQLIESLDRGEEVEVEALDENSETLEQYTIYLYKDDTIAPVNVQYKNQTSVKAPRITAIKLLIKSNINGYKNPFPSDTELSLVTFKEQKGMIYLSMSDQPTQHERVQMTELSRKTLEAFGISSVELIINK